jgi:hypothetical protein
MVTVRHPRLPLGMVWLPFLSAAVYALAWGLRVALWFVPASTLAGRLEEKFSVETRRLGGFITGMAWTLLCSGSYVLFDVAIPEERLGVKVSFL